MGNEKQRPSSPHLGLAYLITTLKQNGVDKIDVYDEGIENDDEILFKKIDMLRPDIIEITAFSFGYKNAINLIKKIKEYTDVPIIIGGHHVDWSF
ncbi:MAG: cobalamin-dependent protein [bacterium]